MTRLPDVEALARWFRHPLYRARCAWARTRSAIHRERYGPRLLPPPSEPEDDG